MKFTAHVKWMTKDGGEYSEISSDRQLYINVMTHNVFIEDYNLAAETLNPCYEEWNRIYAEHHSSERYDDFIVAKIAEKLKGVKFNQIPFTGIKITDDEVIVAAVVKFEGRTVYGCLYLEPAN